MMCGVRKGSIVMDRWMRVCGCDVWCEEEECGDGWRVGMVIWKILIVMSWCKEGECGDICKKGNDVTL